MILSSSGRWQTYYCGRVTGDVAEAGRELPLCAPAGPFLVDVFQSLLQSIWKLSMGLLPNGVSKCQKMNINERAWELRHLLTSKWQRGWGCLHSEETHIRPRSSALQPPHRLTDISAANLKGRAPSFMREDSVLHTPVAVSHKKGWLFFFFSW